MTTKDMDADHSNFFSDTWTWEDILGRVVTRDITYLRIRQNHGCGCFLVPV
jgi:hypothetical protein